jgi:hypothetical protein
LIRPSDYAPSKVKKYKSSYEQGNDILN